MKPLSALLFLLWLLGLSSSRAADFDSLPAAVRPTVDYDRAVRRGFVALSRDSLSSAQHAFEQALRLRPDAPGNDVLRFNIAKILMARRQWHDAENRLREILARKPDFGDAQTAYVECLVAQQRYDRVTTTVDSFLARPDTAHLVAHTAAARSALRLLQAEAYGRLGETEKTEATLRALLRLDPRNAEARSLLARSLYLRGAHDEAMLHLSHVLVRDPDEQTALAVRAELHEHDGNRRAALTDLEHLIRLRPGDLKLQVHRAELLIDLGERTEARRRLDQLRSAGADAAELLPLYHRIR